MKKIAIIISMISLFLLTACGAKNVEEEILSSQENISVPSEDTLETTSSEASELSEEEVNELFEEMMRQVESEIVVESQSDTEASPILDSAIDEMLLLDENGELNPGITE